MRTAETARIAIPMVLSRATAQGPSGAVLYMLLDAARDPLIYEWLSILGDKVESRSLYQGDLGTSLAHVSPYLLQLRNADDEGWRFAVTGYGRNWGVFLVANADFAEVRRHLRKFNIVYCEDKTPLVFRFYDPRVLRRFLPTCTVDELQRLFGPVDAFLAEDEEGASLTRFTLRGGELLQTRLSAGV